MMMYIQDTFGNVLGVMSAGISSPSREDVQQGLRLIKFKQRLTRYSRTYQQKFRDEFAQYANAPSKAAARGLPAGEISDAVQRMRALQKHLKELNAIIEEGNSLMPDNQKWQEGVSKARESINGFWAQLAGIGLDDLASRQVAGFVDGKINKVEMPVNLYDIGNTLNHGYGGPVDNNVVEAFIRK